MSSLPILERELNDGELDERELDRLILVLVGARNPLNIGAAARAMSNFGFRHLRVVNPYAVAFREARSAVGASAVLRQAQEMTTLADAVADCALVVGTTAAGKRELQHPLRRLEAGAGLIGRKLHSGKVALLFGSEKVGLSNSDLSHCHWLMRIPTRGEHRAMNLGQAVAVCLYELIRTRPKGGHLEKPAAVAGEIELLTATLFEVLRATRYWNPGAGAATEEKVRRLVRRLKLGPEDATVLVGMLRQILWKLRLPVKQANGAE
jgi:TrmH family RNA methyltransferase